MPCRFCLNLGLSTHNTHHIKNCHQLLSTRCGYCKGLGHTPKYCAKLARKEHRIRAEAAITCVTTSAATSVLGPRGRAPSVTEHEAAKKAIAAHRRELQAEAATLITTATFVRLTNLSAALGPRGRAPSVTELDVAKRDIAARRSC